MHFFLQPSVTEIFIHQATLSVVQTSCFYRGYLCQNHFRHVKLNHYLSTAFQSVEPLIFQLLAVFRLLQARALPARKSDFNLQKVNAQAPDEITFTHLIPVSIAALF